MEWRERTLVGVAGSAPSGGTESACFHSFVSAFRAAGLYSSCCVCGRGGGRYGYGRGGGGRYGYGRGGGGGRYGYDCIIASLQRTIIVDVMIARILYSPLSVLL